MFNIDLNKYIQNYFDNLIWIRRWRGLNHQYDYYQHSHNEFNRIVDRYVTCPDHSFAALLRIFST